MNKTFKVTKNFEPIFFDVTKIFEVTEILEATKIFEVTEILEATKNFEVKNLLKQQKFLKQK